MLFRALTTAAGRFNFTAGQTNLEFDQDEVADLVAAGCLQPMSPAQPTTEATTESVEQPVESESAPSEPVQVATGKKSKR